MVLFVEQRAKGRGGSCLGSLGQPRARAPGFGFVASHARRQEPHLGCPLRLHCSLAASRTFIIYTLFDVSGHETTASLWLSSVIVCVFISGSIVGFKLAMEASRLVEDYGVDPRRL